MPEQPLDKFRRRFRDPVKPTRDAELDDALNVLQGLPPVGGKRPSALSRPVAPVQPAAQAEQAPVAPAPKPLSRPGRDKDLDAALAILEGARPAPARKEESAIGKFIKGQSKATERAFGTIRRGGPTFYEFDPAEEREARTGLEGALLGTEGKGGRALDKSIRKGLGFDPTEKVGFAESMAKSDIRTKIPFTPFPLMEMFEIKSAADRYKSNDYGDPLDRKLDEQLLTDFAKRVKEDQRRGRSFGGIVHSTLSELPAFMTEIAVSGGTAPAAKKAFEKSVLKAGGRFLKKSAVRSFKAMPAMQQRALTDHLSRRVGTVSIKDGKLELSDASTNPAIDFVRAQGDLFVELFSEQLGEGFSPAGRKILRKFSPKAAAYLRLATRKMRKFMKGNKALNEALRRGGFNGILAEMGEERVGEMLRAALDIQDFGTGKHGLHPKDAWERYKAGFPGGEQALAELVAFTLPGVGRVAGGAALSRFQKRGEAERAETAKGKQANEAEDQVYDKFKQLAQTDPEAAQEAFEQLDSGEMTVEEFLQTPLPEAPAAGEFNIDLPADAQQEPFAERPSPAILEAQLAAREEQAPEQAAEAPVIDVQAIQEQVGPQAWAELMRATNNDPVAAAELAQDQPGDNLRRDFQRMQQDLRAPFQGLPQQREAQRAEQARQATFEIGGRQEEIELARAAGSNLVHTMPDGSTMPGPEHAGSIPETTREAGTPVEELPPAVPVPEVAPVIQDVPVAPDSPITVPTLNIDAAIQQKQEEARVEQQEQAEKKGPQRAARPKIADFADIFKESVRSGDLEHISGNKYRPLTSRGSTLLKQIKKEITGKEEAKPEAAAVPEVEVPKKKKRKEPAKAGVQRRANHNSPYFESMEIIQAGVAPEYFYQGKALRLTDEAKYATALAKYRIVDGAAPDVVIQTIMEQKDAGSAIVAPIMAEGDGNVYAALTALVEAHESWRDAAVEAEATPESAEAAKAMENAKPEEVFGIDLEKGDEVFVEGDTVGEWLEVVEKDEGMVKLKDGIEFEIDQTDSIMVNGGHAIAKDGKLRDLVAAPAAPQTDEFDFPAPEPQAEKQQPPPFPGIPQAEATPFEEEAEAESEKVESLEDYFESWEDAEWLTDPKNRELKLLDLSDDRENAVKYGFDLTIIDEAIAHVKEFDKPKEAAPKAEALKKKAAERKEQQAGFRRVREAQAIPEFSRDDIDRERAISAYSGTSRSPGNAATVEQEQYVNFMEGLRDDALKDIPEGRMADLASELERIKGEYLKRRESVLSTRSGAVSTLVAGRSGFNSKQAAGRSSAVDKAEDKFSKWMSAAKSELLLATGIAEVKRAEATAAAEKKESAKVKRAEAEKAQRRKEVTFPIINEKAEGDVEITKEKWKNTGKDYKGIRVDQEGKFRYRTIVTQKGLESVFITDQKVVKKPTVKESLTVEKPEAAEAPKGAAVIDSLAAIDTFSERLKTGNITPEQLQESYKSYLENREKIKAILSPKPKKQLIRLAGFGLSMSDKKADILKSAMNGISQQFVASGTFQWSPFSETMEEATQRAVDKTTQEDIDKYAEEVKQRQAERDKRLEGLKDPKTLRDFEELERLGVAGKLTTEQKATFDALKAEDRRKREAARKAPVALRKDEVAEDVGFTIVEAYNEKKDIPLHVVQMTDRVDRETFTKLRTLSKKHNGYYSRFSRGRAKPGFQFENREDAEAFAANAKGEEAPAAEAVEPGKAPSKTTKLRETADKLQAKAQASLDQDRQTNTAKRAREAGYAEANARTELELAETMTNIANAIDSGEAVQLAGVKQKTQIEAIQSRMREAQRQAAIKAEPRGGREYDKIKDGPWKDEYADNVEYPEYDVSADQAMNFIRALEDVKGGKLLARQLDSRRKKSGDFVLRPEMADKIIAKIPTEAWWLKGRQEIRRRLERADIKNVAELRAAVREMATVMGEKKQEDPIKAAERELVGKKFEGFDFFPTPQAVADDLAQRADIEPGMTVLEPSAGKGDLATAVQKNEPEAQVAVVEPISALRDVLEAKGFTPVDRDFLEHEGEYDRIVMNPPFSKNRDMEHVRHAYKLLKPGGKLVAIMSEGPFSNSQKVHREFREWFDEVGGESEKREGMFKGTEAFRQTGVNVRIVEIEKPAETAKAAPKAEATVMAAVKLAADSPAELRASDVDRVIDDAENQGLSREAAIEALGKLDVSDRVKQELRDIAEEAEEAPAPKVEVETEIDKVFAKFDKAWAEEQEERGDKASLRRTASDVAVRLAGKRNAELRRSVIDAVMGKPEGRKRPLAKSGVHALEEAFNVRASKAEEAEPTPAGELDLGANDEFAQVKTMAKNILATLKQHVNPSTKAQLAENQLRMTATKIQKDIEDGTTTVKAAIEKLDKMQAKVEKFAAVKPKADQAGPDLFGEIDQDLEDDLFFGQPDKFRAPLSEVIEDAKPADKIKIKALIRKMLGKDVDLEFVDSILNQGRPMLGSFRDRLIQIAEGKANPQDTAVHEAWHAFRAIFATAEENAVADKAFADEEVQAEKFVRYFNTGKGVLGSVRRMFEKMKRRMKAFFGKGNDADKLFDLFDRLQAGKVAERGALRGDTREGQAFRNQTDTPAFKKWFGDSKVVDDAGKPLVVYHGTTATDYVDGKSAKGDAEAYAELATIAEKHGIKHPLDVANILERWADIGPVNISKEEAGRARELTKKATGKYEKGKDVLSFSAFELPEGEQELGSHFGNVEQASTFGTPFPFFLSIENPVRLDDLGTWGYQGVMLELRKAGVDISEKEYDAVFNAVDNNDALRTLLLSKGIDGVVYENEAEGAGDSWIAFSPTQIKSATENVGTFDPTKADIRFRGEVEEMSRKDLQQEAKRIGAPANQSTAALLRIARVANNNPSTWTKEDLNTIVPYLYIHQIFREESVAPVEQDGLNSGMVDPLSNFVRGGFTWNRSLEHPTAVFFGGSLTFKGDSGRISGSEPPVAMIESDKVIAKKDIDAVIDSLRDVKKADIRFRSETDLTTLDGVINAVEEGAKLLAKDVDKKTWDAKMVDLFGDDNAVNVRKIYDLIATGKTAEKIEKGTLPQVLLKAMTRRIVALDKATTKAERRTALKEIRQRVKVAKAAQKKATTEAKREAEKKLKQREKVAKTDQRKATTEAKKETKEAVAAQLQKKVEERLGEPLPGKASDSPLIVHGKAITAALKKGRTDRFPLDVRLFIRGMFDKLNTDSVEARKLDPELNETKLQQRLLGMDREMKDIEFRIKDMSKEQADEFVSNRLSEMFGAKQREAAERATKGDVLVTFDIIREELTKELHTEYSRQAFNLFVGTPKSKTLPSGAKIKVRSPKFKVVNISASLKEGAERLQDRVNAIAAKSFRRRADEDVEQLVHDKLGAILAEDPAKAQEMWDKIQRKEISAEEFLEAKIPNMETREDMARRLIAGIRQTPWKGPDFEKAGSPGLQDLVNDAQIIMGRSQAEREFVGAENKERREFQARRVAEETSGAAEPLKDVEKGDKVNATAGRRAKMYKRNLKSIALALVAGDRKSMTYSLLGDQTVAASNSQLDIEYDSRGLMEKSMKSLNISKADRLGMEIDQERQVLSNGDVIFWTTAQRMELLGLILDPQMRENILHNGFRSADLKTDRDKTITGEGSSPVERYINTQKLVTEILDKMTPEETKLAKEMGKIMTEMGAAGNDVSRRIDARDWFNSESYWPASGKIDRKKAGMEDGDPTLAGKVPQGLVKLVDNFGITIERVPHKNPILIGNAFRSFEEHVRDMSVFVAYAELQRDVNTVLNDPEVEKSIAQRWGTSMIPEIKRYYAYLTYQEGASDKWNLFQKGAAFIQRNFSVSTLGFRMSSIALNRVGGTMMNQVWLLNNMPGVAAHYALRSANPLRVPFAILSKEAKEIREDLLKVGYFKARWETDAFRVFGQTPKEQQRALKAGANELKELGKLRYRQLQNFSMSGMGWAEMRNVVELVQALQDSGKSRAEAIDLAVTITRDTQNPSTPMEDTIMYRDIKRSAFTGVFLPFLGQPTVIADYVGRQIDIARDEAKTDKAAAAKRIAIATLGASLTGIYAVLQRAIVRAASKGVLGDDEEKEEKEKDRELFRRLMDSTQELADIIFPGTGRALDLPHAVIESAISGRRDAFRNLQRPGNVLGRISTSFYQAIRELMEAGQTKDIDFHEAEKIGSALNRSVGALTGLPGGGIEQAVRVGKTQLGFQPFGKAEKAKQTSRRRSGRRSKPRKR